MLDLSLLLILWVGRRLLDVQLLQGWGRSGPCPGGQRALGVGGGGVTGLHARAHRVTHRVILSVLQPGDQPLVLLSEVAPHQGRLPDDHHVLHSLIGWQMSWWWHRGWRLPVTPERSWVETRPFLEKCPRRLLTILSASASYLPAWKLLEHVCYEKIMIVWWILPGGATIFCHFWNRVVFRQSLGLRA